VGVAVASLARLAVGCAHRQAGDRRRLAPTQLSPLLDLEKPAAHRSLDKDSPTPRPVMPPTAGPIIATPEVNGLHHRYDRAAA
jgi:hypothetical protein